VILEEAIRQNVPRQFPLHKSEDEAIGSRRKTILRLAHPTTVIHTLAELQMQSVDTLAVAPQREPRSVVDLRQLREEERNTDEPITEHAFTTTRDLLRYIPLGMFETVPEPLLTPDGAGGIRVEWLRDNRNVRVVIPPEPNRPTFIYHRGVGEPAVKPFSHAAVVQTLRMILLAA
jgi:hypothetical protein